LVLEPLLLAVVLTALSELGDKTQFASLALIAHFKRPAAVLTGCFFGLLIVDGFSAYLGEAIYYLLDQRFIRFASAALFFALALFTALQKVEGKPSVKERGVFTPVLTSMFTMMLLELGDKTQLTTILLSARFGDALSVLIGVLAALMLILGLTVSVGNKIVKHLPLRTVRWLATLAYAVGGAILLFEGVTGLELTLLQSK
jgi:putative Ca2+/H+ antiporter (TMEM165/GDT1 family)